MISLSPEGTAHYRALFLMACCELVKVNLTIILIQRITHAFHCAFDKSNVCGSHANASVLGTHSYANSFTISWRHLNAHSNAFANKPGHILLARVGIGEYKYIFIW